MSDFSIQHEQNGNVTVVTITGAVDSATVGTLDKELEKQISANKRVILDLKEVEFLSSAGVRAIVKALKTAKKSHHKVKLAAIPDHISYMMRTMGLMAIMQVYPTVDEAIASF